MYKKAKPIIDGYFSKCKQYLDMIIVDADSGSNLCSYFKIKSYPTICSFIDGEISEYAVGYLQEDIFEFFNG